MLSHLYIGRIFLQTYYVIPLPGKTTAILKKIDEFIYFIGVERNTRENKYSWFAEEKSWFGEAWL